jgi:hypothetical protein
MGGVWDIIMIVKLVSCDVGATLGEAALQELLCEVFCKLP